MVFNYLNFDRRTTKKFNVPGKQAESTYGLAVRLIGRTVKGLEYDAYFFLP